MNKKSLKIIRNSLFLLSPLIIAGCFDTGVDRKETLQDDIDVSPVGVLFKASFILSSTENVIPFPNNLLFGGSTDGTLNIPVDDETNYKDPTVALNTLDGFSTIAPMATTFTDTIDPATVVAGTSVRVFEVTLSGPGGAVVAINSELTTDDFMVSASGSSLAILPRKPLKPTTSYYVVLTKAIKNTSATPLSAGKDFMYEVVSGSDAVVENGEIKFAAFINSEASDAENLETAGKIETIRQLTTTAESTIENYTVTSDAGDSIADLNKSDIVLSWSFTTQSISDVLDGVYTTINASAQSTSFTNTAITVTGFSSNFYNGTIDLPYYLQAPSTENPIAALGAFWKNSAGSFLTPFSPTPVVDSTQTVALLLAVPASGSSPFPVVIFQHGITGNRSNVLGVVDSLTSKGFAVLSMDLPLHGMVDSDSLAPLFKKSSLLERHFDMDFTNNAASLPEKEAKADGKVDSSGTHFINLASLLTARDNMRQSVADLFTLTKAIETLDYDGGGVDLDASNIYFVGHSLGAIVGATYLAIESDVKSAVLASPGGGVAKLVDGSPTFGPVVSTGLGNNDVQKGTSDYEAFMGAMQTALDSADPINYAAKIANGRAVLLFEIVGNDTNLADQVVPNNVPSNASTLTVGSPTAGTDPLATLMGLNKVSTTQTGSNDIKAWVRYSAGHHSSILTPSTAAGADDTVSASVYLEMQTQMKMFLDTDGSSLPIAEANVISTN